MRAAIEGLPIRKPARNEPTSGRPRSCRCANERTSSEPLCLSSKAEGREVKGPQTSQGRLDA